MGPWLLPALAPGLAQIAILLVAGVILAAGNKVPNVDFAVLGFAICNGDNSVPAKTVPEFIA
jgi:hypothetical protein